MINIALVDDSAEDLSALEGALNSISEKVQEDFRITSYTSGLDFLREYTDSVDIVFLDIDMPDLNGMEIAANLRKRSSDLVIVFSTNYASFAVQSYDVHANDFVLKPVNSHSLFVKMHRLINIVNKRKTVLIPITAHTNQILQVPSDTICYIEVSDHLVTFYTTSGTYEQRGSISHLEKQLSALPFMRCNNYTLINLKHVSSVYKDEICVNDRWIKMSRPRKKEFLTELSNYLGGAR